MSYYQYSNHAEYSVGSAGYKPMPDTCNSYPYLSHQVDYSGNNRGYSQSSGHYSGTSSAYNQQPRSDYLQNSTYSQNQSISPYFPSSYGALNNKPDSNYGSTYSAQSSSYRRPSFGHKIGIMSLEVGNTDPVTKAVINNMMGTAPTNRMPKTNLKCTVCGITSLSQSTMDTHLAGAKHGRKVKERELEEQKTLIEHSGIIKKGQIYRCTVCEMDVNSLHQLQAHVNGSKHKTKLNGPVGAANIGSVNNATGEAASASVEEKASGSVSEEKPKEAKEITQYYCPSCNVCSNSETQYEQHVTSRKHHLRSSGRKVPRKPYSKSATIVINTTGDASGQENGYQGRYRQQQQLYSRQPMPLSATFVSGGINM